MLTIIEKLCHKNNNSATVNKDNNKNNTLLIEYFLGVSNTHIVLLICYKNSVIKIIS